ncbi:hypothetical protein DFJ74DRAFT_714026 [Hyaloraphidium curvatum]|nr:hypothetical protein DFJ74DRAFT_714026 [Hyaloraphidium curvatum]
MARLAVLCALLFALLAAPLRAPHSSAVGFPLAAAAALPAEAHPAGIRSGDRDAPDAPRLDARQLVLKKTTTRRLPKKTTTRKRRTTSRRRASTKRPQTTARPAARNTTSWLLIQEDLRAGRLSQPVAALYRAFAEFGDPLLPAKYRVPVSSVPREDASTRDALVGLLAAYSRLSAAQRAQADPYFMPPMHGRSWWQRRFAPGSAGGSRPSRLRARSDHHGQPAGTAAAGLSKRQAPTDPLDPTLMLREWDSWASLDGNARVCMPQVRYESTDRALALRMANEIPRIWAAHRRLLGRVPKNDFGSRNSGRGGDDRLDIALVDANSYVLPYGRSCTSDSPAYVGFNRAAPSWKDELAHELFHAFQYAFRVRTNCIAIDYAWLQESTAQWAMDYVYPRNADQHRAAKFWMDSPHMSLDDESAAGTGRRYGGYIVWHYAAQVLRDPSRILHVWLQAATKDQLPAVDAVFPGGLRKHWPLIALHSFNKGTLNHLAERGLARGPAVFGGGTAPIDLTLEGANVYAPELQIDLPYLSATYVHMRVNDTALRGFTWYNSHRFALDRKTVAVNVFGAPYDALVFEGRGYTSRTRGVAIWAVWRLQGKTTWERPEEWTDVPFRRFCLDKRGERLAEIAVVYANSEFADKSYRTTKLGSVGPTVIMSDMFCHAAKGTSKVTATWNGGSWVADASALSFETTPSVGNGGSGTDSLSTYKTLYTEGVSQPPADCNITIPGTQQIDFGACLPYMIAPTRFFPAAGTVAVVASGTTSCDPSPPETAISTAAGTFAATDNGLTYLDLLDSSLSGPAHRSYVGSALDTSEGSVVVHNGCTGLDEPTVGGPYLLTARSNGRAQALQGEGGKGVEGSTQLTEGSFVWKLQSEREA